MDIHLDVPAIAAKKLANGEVDLALVPIGSLIDLDSYHILSDYCISATGSVYSVAIFSDHPIQEVDAVILDSQSRTSNALARLLLEAYWKVNPLIVGKEIRLPSKAKVARVIIGDKAFGLEHRYRYKYDLSEYWYTYTGLPFVFAAWASKGKLPVSFVDGFNNALKQGVESIPNIVSSLSVKNPEKAEFYTKYLQHFIEYDLTDKKRTSLQTFLHEIQQVVV